MDAIFVSVLLLLLLLLVTGVVIAVQHFARLKQRAREPFRLHHYDHRLPLLRFSIFHIFIRFVLFAVCLSHSMFVATEETNRSTAIVVVGAAVACVRAQPFTII